MTLDPLVILLVGVVIVIGMIIVLRVNAFIALITAAMVVSLLAKGALPEKIERVASAFGAAVGGIGIVIALAAVIGKCMMDSGAADRIVRAFLNALGEKRAPTALMGSGFVLAIPVFFDTVFYLLVPLARSLWRRTRKNYLLYILAISTGGAITHTLVPPTPGPLFMANLLSIDLGVMMMIGALVALPTAIVGLMVSGLLNRMMDVPMRPYAGEPEAEPLRDDQLPSLWISLLPVILPVILISTNTLTKIWADAEHAALVQTSDIEDLPGFAAELVGPANSTAPVAQRVFEQLPEDVRTLVQEASDTNSVTEEDGEKIVVALNGLLAKPGLFDDQALAAVTLQADATKLRGQGLVKLTQAEVERFNRLVLEAAYPERIKAHTWETSRRYASYVTGLLGNPNLALLLSAAIAMFVLVQNRKLSFVELGKATEVALMSGGVIILITAGGGAFGAMLRAAGVQDSVEQFIDKMGANVGLAIVLAGFGVSAVLKIAQGSSTVAMITTASMFAAMNVSSQMLGFHCVYLATAIGSGSLFGSWMNDSGFWIFARMGVLTEVEALKSWTILLAIVAVVGLGVTLMLSWLLPLV